MMVIDSSALVAILENEPEAKAFLAMIGAAHRRATSAVTIFETGVVLGRRRGWDRVNAVWELAAELQLEIVPFEEPYISIATAAYQRFGKGIDSKARLNLGDCASYSVARAFNMPLLFKGQDFRHTDVRVAI